jgi:hypothetical protein
MDDDEIMKDMTPEKRECFVAGLKRAQVIRDQVSAALESDLPEWDRIDRILDLIEEHEEMYHKLQRLITPGWEPEAPPVDCTVLRLSNKIQRE